MVKPPERLPANVVMFKTDVRMTDWDVRNYLEKIYKVPVSAVKSRIFMGELKGSTKGITKKDDYKLTHVTLAGGQTFKWPELFPQDKEEEKKDDYEKTLKEVTKDRKISPDQAGAPAWLA